MSCNIPLNTIDPAEGQSLSDIEIIVNDRLRNVSLEGADGREVRISLCQIGNTLRVTSSRQVTIWGREEILRRIIPLLGQNVFQMGISVLGWMPNEPPAGTKACYREHGGFDGRENT